MQMRPVWQCSGSLDVHASQAKKPQNKTVFSNIKVEPGAIKYMKDTLKRSCKQLQGHVKCVLMYSICQQLFLQWRHFIFITKFYILLYAPSLTVLKSEIQNSHPPYTVIGQLCGGKKESRVLTYLSNSKFFVCWTFMWQYIDVLSPYEIVTTYK